MKNMNIPPFPIFDYIMNTIKHGGNEFPPESILSNIYQEFIGEYIGVATIEKANIENQNSNLFLSITILGVYGMNSLRKPILQNGSSLYIVNKGVKMRVILEKVQGQQWLIVGNSKYRKVD